ncbi:glycosyltransferase family 2 protein [Mesobacillus maritimus]|uniref:glycosyltransferase family 2 protein n=1 Tax=Mesobacillus maritimus TaxID=1643336 RepID=UPI00384FC2B9
MRIAKQIIILITLIAIWMYIGWRTIFTLPAGIALIPGILLLVSEITLAIQNTLLFSIIYRPNDHPIPPKIKTKKHVDILLATYNESVDIVRRTVVACQNIDYPKECFSIWICDDGNRIEMKNLASTLGVGYITRETNIHAKAGNLNNALLKTNGELVVTIDADMMPKPTFLKHTLGYFEDSEVAFVQTPQSFYNDDIFQYNLGQGKNIPNEQDLFMRTIQSGVGRLNSTLYVGSNTIFRRGAIEAIGGFATGTITEDMATGMLIQTKGYKTIFHNEVLAQGLTAETLQDYLQQRIRWARGTIQTMRKWNPITLPGLSVVQRLVYVSYFLYWYFGVFRMVFIFAPIVYLLFGIPALVATLDGMLMFWVPQFILALIAERMLLENRLKRTWSSIYEISVAPFLAWAVLVETFAKKGIPFKVTNKGVTTTKAKVNIPFLVPHLVIIFIGIFAIVLGLKQTQDQLRDGTLINLFWALYNVMISIPVLLLAREKPKVRKSERFKKRLLIDILDNDLLSSGATIDISETGCRLFVGSLKAFSEEIIVIIHGTTGTHRLKGQIVYYDTFGKGYQLGIRFHDMEESDYQFWVKEVYGAIPPESMFKYKNRTGVLYVLLTFLKDIFSPARKEMKRMPQREVNRNCQIVIIDPTMDPKQDLTMRLKPEAIPPGKMKEASLTKIGDHGCTLSVEGLAFTAKELIGVRLPNHEYLYLGQVTDTKVQDSQVKIELKWVDQENGPRLLEDLS